MKIKPARALAVWTALIAGCGGAVVLSDGGTDANGNADAAQAADGPVDVDGATLDDANPYEDVSWYDGGLLTPCPGGIGAPCAEPSILTYDCKCFYLQCIGGKWTTVADAHTICP